MATGGLILSLQYSKSPTFLTAFRQYSSDCSNGRWQFVWRVKVCLMGEHEGLGLFNLSSLVKADVSLLLQVFYPEGPFSSHSTDERIIADTSCQQGRAALSPAFVSGRLQHD